MVTKWKYGHQMQVWSPNGSMVTRCKYGHQIWVWSPDLSMVTRCISMVTRCKYGHHMRLWSPDERMVTRDEKFSWSPKKNITPHPNYARLNCQFKKNIQSFEIWNSIQQNIPSIRKRGYRSGLTQLQSCLPSYLIFVIFCTLPHFLACKLYARKVLKFATKNCLATRPHKSILGVLAVLVGLLAGLVGVLAILVGVLGVLCIGMVYLLLEFEHSELGLMYLAFSVKQCKN